MANGQALWNALSYLEVPDQLNRIIAGQRSENFLVEEGRIQETKVNFIKKFVIHELHDTSSQVYKRNAETTKEIDY